MRVLVDDDSCRGHGVCAALCPTVFTISDGGYAEATASEIPLNLEAAVVEAISSCPESAIHNA